MRPSPPIGAAARRGCFGLLVLALIAGACDTPSNTGEVQVSYTLQNLQGQSLDCATAGVATVRLTLYAERGDAEPAFLAQVDCAVDDDGVGEAVAAHGVGFYDSVWVTLLDPTGEVVALADGSAADWEYLAVELTGGGVTPLLPPLVVVLDATPAD